MSRTTTVARIDDARSLSDADLVALPVDGEGVDRLRLVHQHATHPVGVERVMAQVDRADALELTSEENPVPIGVVLYDGETCAPFGDRLFAVPIRTLWEP